MTDSDSWFIGLGRTRLGQFLSNDMASFDDPPNRSLVDDPLPDAVHDALDPVVETASDGQPHPGASTVLITGPIGGGKTYLAKSLLGDLGLPVLDVSKHTPFTDLATGIQSDIFDVAFDAAPCAVLFDDFEEYTYHPRRTLEEVLKQNLERASSTGDIIVVATVSGLDDIEKPIRRPGRFDVLCPLELPDSERRRHLLDTYLTAVDTPIDLPSEDRADIAELMEGFTPAGIGTIIRRAAAAAAGSGTQIVRPILVECVQSLDRDRSLDPADADSILGDNSFDSYYAYEENLVHDDDSDDPLEFTWDCSDGDDGDEEAAHMAVQRTANVPEISFDDIGGLKEAKRALREAIEWPNEYPELCEELELDLAQGILLHGPPGNGKTMLAKAIANETDSQFISVKGPEVMDKYVGESQKFIDELFTAARQLAPSVVFIDEIDSITDERGGSGVEVTTDSVVNQLLLELDGLNELSEVVIIGATNRPDIIDGAVKRPGRLGRQIYVPPPDDQAAREIFDVHLRGRTVAEDVSLAWLIENADGEIMGAEIAAICEEAARSAMRREIDDPADVDPEERTIPITKADFESAFAVDRESIDQDDMTAFH